jgi:hypothetical protein
VPLWENFAEKMWGEETELYDLSADPGEESNLAPDRRAIVERLTKELDRWWQPKP